MQEFHEYPLLHQADLMLALLRAGSRRTADLDAALRHLRRDLATAGERPPFTADDMRAELAVALYHLEQAKLVMRNDRGAYRTTARGRRVLADYPLGVDDSVLMQFPEFREHVARVARADHPGDPAFRTYQRGFAGFLAGRSHADNPHRPDTVMHLAWENGWFEARDAVGPWASTRPPVRAKKE